MKPSQFDKRLARMLIFWTAFLLVWVVVLATGMVQEDKHMVCWIWIGVCLMSIVVKLIQLKKQSRDGNDAAES